MKTFERLIIWVLFFSLVGLSACRTMDTPGSEDDPESYISYFTGNRSDVSSIPEGGVCLMGGAAENDEAMRWFLQRAAGGDILVLRASGSDGYNNYFHTELGIAVNSVETIVFVDRSASSDPYVLERIQKAEAVWIAGGDQWDYVRLWRGTPVADSVNQALIRKNIVIGGTSAGMAILGGLYFTAEKGTVTSAEALADPYNPKVTVGSDTFITTPGLSNIITDTHYDNPDRRGRHMVFLARILTDEKRYAKGIACDEYTAVCIDEKGEARVFGGFPEFDDNAYFISPDDPGASHEPEICVPGEPLTWDRKGRAMKVIKIKGTAGGYGRFDLNEWRAANGAMEMAWSVIGGIFFEHPLN